MARSKVKPKHQYAKRKKSTSIYKGVTYHKGRGLYVVYLNVNGENIYIGNRKREYDAGRLYDEAVKEFFGDAGMTNEKLGLFGGEAVPLNKVKFNRRRKIAQIELTDGKVAIVDLADYPRVQHERWFTTYLRGRPLAVNSRGWRMHRLILDNPKDKIVKHIDGNMLNNRRKNLELVDRHNARLMD